MKHSPLKAPAIGILFSSVFVGHHGLAQNAVDDLELLYGDEETVSIATGTSKALRLAPAVATVITADDIRALGATSLDDILETVPGLHVSVMQRYSSHYSLRGIHTTYNPEVLLLLNGVPLVDSYSGGRIPRLMVPVQNIKRVEIIRGPGSAVYGADAVAGVINIITYSADDISDFSAGARSGSFGTHGAWFNNKTEFGAWQFSASMEWQQTDGDTGQILSSDFQTILDGYFGTTASLAPGHLATQHNYVNGQLLLSNEHWRLAWNGFKQNGAGLGSGVADALDYQGRQDTQLQVFGVNYKRPLNTDWEVEAQGNFIYTKQRSYYTIFPPGAVLPIGADGNLTQTDVIGLVEFTDGYIGNPGASDAQSSFEFTSYYVGSKHLRMRISAGLKQQDMETLETKNFGPGILNGTQPVVDGTLTDVSDTDFIFMRDQSRDVYFLSSQAEWSLYKDWELTAGIRYDDYSDFGHTINPRLALVWQTNYKLTSKLLYGSAFRAPTFGEQFSINNPILLGNANLEPAEIDTWELAFDYRISYDTRIQANLFSYQFDDLIDYVVDDGASSKTAQNAFDQKGKGIELEAHWTASENIALIASVSWQDSENKNTGNVAPNAAQQLGYLEMRWKFSNHWRLTTQLHHVADRERDSDDTRQSVDDYSLVNLHLYSEKLTRYFDFGVVVRNLAGAEAAEPGNRDTQIDIPLPGRSFLFSATYHLD